MAPGVPVCPCEEWQVSFHQRKKRRLRIGLPELVAMALIALTAALATRWWRTAGQPGWVKVPGRTVSCEIRRTHFNAEPSRDKVALGYEYEVAGRTFSGSWMGYWPKVHSPNALPDGQIEKLRTKAYPLVVHYNPQNPSQSRLHNPDPDALMLYTLLAFGSGIALIVYGVRLYPAWKRRRSHAFG